MNLEDIHPVFFELWTGLSRLGPGSTKSTKKALSLLPKFSEGPEILDIGCGNGAQTLVLAEHFQSHIIAVDYFPVFLNDLQKRAQKLGVDHLIETQQGDMSRLDFSPNSFDLIWSEGAIYIMGFANALKAFRPMIRPHGFFVVSEFTWLTQNPSAKIKMLGEEECPFLGDTETNLRHIEENGYQSLGHFLLPDSDWLEPYYNPLEKKLGSFREKYASDKDALQAIESVQVEIDMFRECSHEYGYIFYVMQRAD